MVSVIYTCYGKRDFFWNKKNNTREAAKTQQQNVKQNRQENDQRYPDPGVVWLRFDTRYSREHKKKTVKLLAHPFFIAKNSTKFSNFASNCRKKICLKSFGKYWSVNYFGSKFEKFQKIIVGSSNFSPKLEFYTF